MVCSRPLPGHYAPFGGWSFTQDLGSSAALDLPQQLEHAVLAEVEQEQALDSTW